MRSSLTSIGFCFLPFFKTFPHLQNLISLPSSLTPLCPKRAKQENLPACIYPTTASLRYSIICQETKSKQTSSQPGEGGTVPSGCLQAKRDIFLIFVVPVFPASDEWENMGNITGGKHCGNLSGLSASLSTLSSLLPQPCFWLSFIL